MINKLKIGFLIAVLSILTVAANANAAALTFTDDTAITIGGSEYFILDNSEATSVVLNTAGTTLTVVVPALSTFTLVSNDRNALTNDLVLAQTCDGHSNKVAVTGAATVVFTPDSTTPQCAAATGGNGGSSHHSSSGSGGGGGGSSSSSNDDDDDETPAGPVEGCAAGSLFSITTGKACSTAVVGCGSGNLFSPITGQACGVNTTNTVVITTPGSAGNFGYAFGTAVVKQGSKGEGCRAWQNFLNTHRNAGLVADGMCGPLTIGAAKAWQVSVGLVGDGLLGPMSRAKANVAAGMQ